MSSNFVIWTKQRSGGTSFVNLLMNMHQQPTLLEPFNGHRELVDMRDGFARARASGEPFEFDGSRLLDNNHKICYEFTHEDFNERLFRFFQKEKYYQILLVRKNEKKRLESLALAELTGAFKVEKAKEVYPKILDGTIQLEPLDIERLVDMAKRANVRHNKIHDLFRSSGLPIFYMEDYFAGSFEERVLRFNTLVSEMKSADVDLRTTEQTEADIEEYFMRRDQKSANLVDYIPNIDEFRRRIDLLSFIKDT